MRALLTIAWTVFVLSACEREAAPGGDAAPAVDSAVVSDTGSADARVADADTPTRDAGRDATPAPDQGRPRYPVDAAPDAARDRGVPDAAPDVTVDAAPDVTVDAAPDATVDAAVDAAPDAGPRWRLAQLESFDAPLALDDLRWQPDPVPDDGPFADGGEWFRDRGVVPPEAYRISAAFRGAGWLTAELYTRHPQETPANSLLSRVPDPDDPTNTVLRLATPRHTDGAVIRPTEPLPERYRISLRVGHARYGDGVPGGPNGYDTLDERAEPWRDVSATSDNGFYWLAILDAVPRPHNNQWIHHHRKAVIDSDNHSPPFLSIWDGEQYVASGEHPVMMFLLDGLGVANERSGKPFIAWANGAWQVERDVGIRAVDAYRDDTWYTALIERDGDRITLEVSGDFRHGGQQTYRATLDAREHCVWHFPRAPEEREPRCEDPNTFEGLEDHPLWPEGGAWPDWFFFGDPHANYYEGHVLYDDVRLEVFR